jgi:hypothetical protein
VKYPGQRQANLAQPLNLTPLAKNTFVAASKSLDPAAAEIDRLRIKKPTLNLRLMLALPHSAALPSLLA